MSVKFEEGDVVCLKSEAKSYNGKVKSDNRLTVHSIVTNVNGDTLVKCKYLLASGQYDINTFSGSSLVHIDNSFLPWKK